TRKVVVTGGRRHSLAAAWVPHEGIAAKFDKIGSNEGMRDVGQAGLDELQQVVVTDVPGSYKEESLRRTDKQVVVAEVCILADDNSKFLVSQAGDLQIGGPVPVRQRRGVHDVVTMLA